MKRLFERLPKAETIAEAAWFLLWFSLPLSLKGSGALLVGVALITLFRYFSAPRALSFRRLCIPVLMGLLFLWTAKDILAGTDAGAVWKEAEKKLSLLVIPLIFLLGRTARSRFTLLSLSGLGLSLALLGVAMTGRAAWRFAETGNWSVFTYHEFAGIGPLGAVYLSLYLLFMLFMAGDPDGPKINPRIRVILVLFYFVLLLLCASRMLIALGIPLLAWHYRARIAGAFRESGLLRWITLLVIVAGSFPVIQRVATLKRFEPEILRRDSFIGVPEPDGLTLRLILWRFGREILDEEHAWFAGTGLTQTQERLNAKIVQFGMYTGSGKAGDTGYLNYNFHNQYIETMVRSGWPGLLILLSILAIFAIKPPKSRFMPVIFLWVFGGLFLTESVLERQAGIVFFCLLVSAGFPDENHGST